MIIIIGKKSFLANSLKVFLIKKKIKFLNISYREISKINNIKEMKNIFLFTFFFKNSELIKNISILKKIKKIKKFKLFYPSTIGLLNYKNLKNFKKNSYYLEKDKNERFIISNFDRYNIFRIPNIYGLKMRSKTKFMLFSKLVKNNKKIKHVHNSSYRDYMHEEDLNKVFLCYLNKDNKKKIINLCSDNIYNEVQLIELMKKVLNKNYKKKLNIVNDEVTKLHHNRKTKNFKFTKLQKGLKKIII